MYTTELSIESTGTSPHMGTQIPCSRVNSDVWSPKQWMGGLILPLISHRTPIISLAALSLGFFRCVTQKYSWAKQLWR